jgi:hypothetical protein
MVHLLVSSGHRIDEQKWLLVRGNPDRSILHVIETAAHLFALQRAALDRDASSAITGLRNRAKSRLEKGEPMPEPPQKIYALQALRLAAEVRQMVSLQNELGSQGSAWLEAFLGNEFTRGGE